MSGYFHLNKYKVPLYRGYFGVAITNDCAKVDKVYCLGRGEIYAHCVECSHMGKKSYDVILNFDNENRGISHGCISHEALHAVMMLSDDRGILLSEEASEAPAYLIEWVVDRIYETIERYKFSDRVIAWY